MRPNWSHSRALNWRIECQSCIIIIRLNTQFSVKGISSLNSENERSGSLWLPLHHPGGCCTQVVDEEIPPFNVKRFECLEKRYINVTNYYY